MHDTSPELLNTAASEITIINPPEKKFFVFVVIGILGGLLSGVFGVGGGIIMVPLLMVWGSMDARQASATSLFVIAPTAVTGSITYGVNGYFLPLLATVVALFALIGSFAGSLLLERANATALKWSFVGLQIVAGVTLLIDVPVPHAIGEENSLVLYAGVALLGLVAGSFSSFFGAGGGILLVPFLILAGWSDLEAKSISLLALIPASIAGTVSNYRAKRLNMAKGWAMILPAAAGSLCGALLATNIDPAVSRLSLAILAFTFAVAMTIAGFKDRH